MKKILIISPHFPPSNLAAVHRSRLFAMHLPSFGWEPIILTVQEKYYEENLDDNLSLLLPTTLRIEKVKAFKVTKPRIIGDIGLRAFFQFYSKAKKIIKEEKIDFLFIPIPSFYIAILGRLLNKSTGIQYGIDYIDPWVHKFPGSEKVLSRHWFSTKVAEILEPIALKKVALITGVAEGYYESVFKRNPKLIGKVKFGSMPYGGEISDHTIIENLSLRPYLFEKNNNKFQLVYAGAMLPKAYTVLEQIFESISKHNEIFKDVEFHFIGTGKNTNDDRSFNIKPLAEKYNLWQNIIFEYPKRIPYMDVLVHLESSNGVFVLGSTEPHYTPSKVYQAVLAKKYILSVLHEQSTAAKVIRDSNAGIVLTFDGVTDLKKIEQNFAEIFIKYKEGMHKFSFNNVDKDIFEQYSAKEVTGKLVNLINQVFS